MRKVSWCISKQANRSKTRKDSLKWCGAARRLFIYSRCNSLVAHLKGCERVCVLWRQAQCAHLHYFIVLRDVGDTIEYNAMRMTAAGKTRTLAHPTLALCIVVRARYNRLFHVLELRVTATN